MAAEARDNAEALLKGLADVRATAAYQAAAKQTQDEPEEGEVTDGWLEVDSRSWLRFLDGVKLGSVRLTRTASGSSRWQSRVSIGTPGTEGFKFKMHGSDDVAAAKAFVDSTLEGWSSYRTIWLSPIDPEAPRMV